MTKIIQKLLAGSALCMALGAAPANAADLTFLWQWDGTSLRGITTEGTTVLQNANIGTQYIGSYILFNAQTVTNDFSAAFNFYTGSTLAFTYGPSGTAGSTTFAVPLLNAVNGPLTPLAGGTSLIASSDVQTLLKFDAGRDTYTLQFQNLDGPAPTPAVPEPATWAMMLTGFGVVGFAMRRRSKVRTNVSFA